MAARGLSPRVRGNHNDIAYHGRAAGSIPACAGEPGGRAYYHAIKEVYPRVCGGTGNAPYLAPGFDGLSPRVRGNLWPILLAACTVRSIPACAGEPARFLRLSRSYKVYPRVCGGTGSAWGGVRYRMGLSPRVRGNLFAQAFSAPRLRSIPACAGEPVTRFHSASTSKVYPRVCGGTHRRQRPLDSGKGLSPRVRGNRGLRPPDPR